MLRASHLATTHSILLDVLLEHQQQHGFIETIGQCLLDTRLYHVGSLRYWIEQGLIAAWASLSAPDRAKVLENIASVRESRHLNGELYEKQLLARIPVRDLPENFRELRPVDDEPASRPCRRPQSSVEIGGEWTPVSEPDDDDAIDKQLGQWPDAFQREPLKILYRAGNATSRKETPAEDLKKTLEGQIQAALVVVPVLRSHTKLLHERTGFWIWRAIKTILNDYRSAYGNDSETHPPEALIRDCAELALAVLSEGPGKLKGKLPENDLWNGCPESAWTHALSLADVALTWPPAADDSALQDRFISIIQGLFATAEPLAQLCVVTTIRPWHWFRSSERRELHDQLIWKTPKHATVLTWSLSRTSNYPDPERAGLYRLLLNRGDVDNPKELARRLGRDIGLLSMHVFVDAGRSALAGVAREALTTPQSFSLFKKTECRHEFLRNFAFGMKEHAPKMSKHTELAPEFGEWNLKAWRELRPQRKRRRESESVVLFATHWLEKKEANQADRTNLKTWWQHIQPLLKAVVDEGGKPDCFTLFFNLRDGDYNDLTTPEELMYLVDQFAQRLIDGATRHGWNLDETNPQQHEHEPWRECAEYAAETVDSLRRDGSLRTDLQREQAHQLLSKLAAQPISSSKAVEFLHRLQNE